MYVSLFFLGCPLNPSIDPFTALIMSEHTVQLHFKLVLQQYFRGIIIDVGSKFIADSPHKIYDFRYYQWHRTVRKRLHKFPHHCDKVKTSHWTVGLQSSATGRFFLGELCVSRSILRYESF